jgi:hypothetical protein
MLLQAITIQTGQIGQTATDVGVGLGSVIAVVCSWQRSRSILWAMLHGFLGWFYVIYFAVTREPGETR